MKISVRNIIIRLVTFLLIGIMSMLIANKVVFLHVHKMADGAIIVHAHPYEKSNDTKPYKSHHHSDTELLFLQNIEILFLIIFIVFTLLTLAKQTKHVFNLAIWDSPIYINLNKGRAPPIS